MGGGSRRLARLRQVTPPADPRTPTLTMRPKFGSYHTGPWPHSPSDGVGLVLEGYPTDVHAFMDLMHRESCNPVATRRILDSLAADGFKRTTVMASLNFAAIGDALSAIGVTLRIVEPLPVPWRGEVDDAAFDLIRDRTPDMSSFSEAEIAEVHRRFALAQTSMQTLPHDFGPYGPRTN